jgi:hypothetical protein
MSAVQLLVDIEQRPYEVQYICLTSMLQCKYLMEKTPISIIRQTYSFSPF